MWVMCFAACVLWQANIKEKMVRTQVFTLKDRAKDTGGSVPTVFDTVLNPDPAKGEYTPSDHDLTADAVFLFVAGTDTTANTLSLGTWQLLKNPSMLQTMQTELRQVMPEKDMTPDWVTLENLPYLVRASLPPLNFP